MDYKDFTIKAKIDNEKFIIDKLASLHAELIGVDVQTDHYFKTDQGKLKWRQGSIENLITHYKRTADSGIEKTEVYRYDLNPTPEEINEFIKAHEKIGEIKKVRTIYKIENIKIHIDKFNSELFLEIEAIDRENQHSDDQLRQSCMTIKSYLGLRDEQLIKTGYFAN